MKRICVFCGSRAGRTASWRNAATALGTAIAARGIELVYGGGGRGMMGAVADAALAADGRVIGVIPRDLFLREHLHKGITELRAVEGMLERKSLMASLSDGFISLPGGIGTMDELFEMWTWAQLGIHDKPSVLLNIDGYYDALIAFLDHMTDAGYLEPHQRVQLRVATSADDALQDLLQAAVPPTDG
ncbi:MAG: TIGR00730 family Rossman fold protein [Thiotrichales bacterium]|nr:TIGR00730 family Rossman fold protein [Thiotrichales bacterium]MCY4283808.1 TIGR00730 family Rossman fold protein [Thiotrichales bacterium]MCY4350011.1 TIGR00730 family Rossman fold protein [Thiotrichales bacterium]